MEKTKLTEKDLSEGLKIFSQWFPEETKSIKRHQQAIIDHIVGDCIPEVGSPLLLQDHTNLSRRVSADQAVFTPCAEAIAVVIADVALFVLDLAGVDLPIDVGPLATAILVELGEQRIRVFIDAIKEFNSASGAQGKAKALFKIVVEMYNLHVFSVVFTVIKDKMSWWDWVKTGLVAAAQIALWVASDGLAFIIKAALKIMSAAQLLADAIKAGNVCSC